MIYIKVINPVPKDYRRNRIREFFANVGKVLLTILCVGSLGIILIYFS